MAAGKPVEELTLVLLPKETALREGHSGGWQASRGCPRFGLGERRWRQHFSWWRSHRRRRPVQPARELRAGLHRHGDEGGAGGTLSGRCRRPRGEAGRRRRPGPRSRDEAARPGHRRRGQSSRSGGLHHGGHRQGSRSPRSSAARTTISITTCRCTSGLRPTRTAATSSSLARASTRSAARRTPSRSRSRSRPRSRPRRSSGISRCPGRRSGTLWVMVADAQGKPVPGAVVQRPLLVEPGPPMVLRSDDGRQGPIPDRAVA